MSSRGWLFILVGCLVSCEREERDFRVDAPSASAVEAAREGPRPPRKDLPATPPAMSPATLPATAQSFGLVKHDYQRNAYALAEGQRLFHALNCDGCHARGGGGIGPPLMDEAWIHGSDPEEIFGDIVDGWPNGMPPFRGKIADDQVWRIVAYVRSLSGLADRGAAPGRTDHMAGPPPPNTIARGLPRISTLELDELRQEEEADFDRRGWADRASGRVRIPEPLVQQMERTGAGAPVTRPAQTPPTRRVPRDW